MGEEEHFAPRHIWEAVTDWQVWCLSLINMSVITPGASPYFIYPRAPSHRGRARIIVVYGISLFLP